MKSFNFDKATKTNLKNESPILIKEVQSLNSYISHDVKIPLCYHSTSKLYYHLKSVLTHIGKSLNEGHHVTYTVCTSNKVNIQKENIWIKFDYNCRSLYHFDIDILLNEKNIKSVYMLLYKLTNDYKNRVNINKYKHLSKSKQKKSKMSKVLIPGII